MKRLSQACVASFGAVLLVSLFSAGSLMAQSQPRVESRPYAAIPSVAGQDNFGAYCAVCHGKDARGGGPAAPAMKVPVPDLTTLAQRHGGRFDSAAVEYIIRGTGKTTTPAHGVQEMPIWGHVFDPTLDDHAVTSVRIANLVRYLESIQVPAVATGAAGK